MPLLRPDPTFHPSPKMAMDAPQETLAYLVMVDPKKATPDAGAMQLDPKFFLDSGTHRPHQVRLEGGDASSDSYCYA